jgi:hypothetical protein
MAATVAIAVEINDDGVVKGVRDIEGALDKIGKNPVFQTMRKQQREAREAAQLLGRTLGVEIPAGLEKAIAKTQFFGRALSLAFKATLVLALVAALVELVPKIEAAAQSMGGFTDAMREANKEAAEFNRRMLTGFGNLGVGAVLTEQTRAQIAAIDQRREALQKELETVKAADALPGAGLVRQIVLRKELADLSAQGTKLEAVLHEQEERTAELLNQNAETRKAAEKASQEVENAGRTATLSGIDQIREKWRLYWNEQVARGVDLMTAQKSTQQQMNAEIAAYLEQRAQKEKAAAEKTSKMWERVEQSRREAADRSLLHLKANFDEQIAAGEKTIERNNRMITGLQELGQIESETAALRAQVAGDSVTAILIQEDFRAQKTIENLKTMGLGEQELAEARLRLNEQTNLRIVQEQRNAVNQMADQFVSLFDDITSGNIGRRLLNMFKRFIAQLLAQWILGMGQMRNAYAGGGGGGLFGGLLSSLFGFGGGGGGGGGLFGGGVGGLVPGSAAASALGLPGATGAAAPAGFGGFSTSSIAGGGLLSAGGSTSGLASLQAGPMGLLTKIFGKGSVSLFGKSLPAGQLGGLGLSLGLSGILGGLAGQGPVMSGIQGGLGGIFTGLALGGPLGALAGAGIFVASLLAGIFGADQKKKDAIRAAKTMAADFGKIVEAYKNYQLDYESARQQLSQSYVNAKGQLQQFGKGPAAAGVQRGLDPVYFKAQKEIYEIEQERKGRRELGLSAPEFHRGGEVMERHRRRFHSGGEVPAVLKVGEHVIQEKHARRNRRLLERINAGEDVGAVTVVVQALDSADVERWLRRGGARKIREGLRYEETNF